MKILIVGTSENRLIIENTDPYYDNMPELQNKDGSIVTPNKCITDLEKDKRALFTYLKKYVSIGDDYIYYTIDPSFSNTKKCDNEDMYYGGHLSMLLDDIPDNYKHTFDIIIIMNCYNDFFSENNIDKINYVLKSSNTIYIPNGGVSYIISEYMLKNLNYMFINV